MRGVEGALHVLEAVRKGGFASEELRRIGSGGITDTKVDKAAQDVMSAPDLTLASSLVYIVQRRRELWRTILEEFLKNNRQKDNKRSSGQRDCDPDSANQTVATGQRDKGFDSLPAHVQDCLLVGAGGLLELRHFASAVLVNALLNELRTRSQAHGERRERWVPLVNAVLRGVSERGPERLEALRKSPTLEDRALWAGVPVWSLPAWSRTWSRAELNKLFELLPQPSASCLRVAPSHREKVLKLLGEADIEVVNDQTANKNCNAIRLKSTVLPTSVPGFQDGFVTVQSEGSILVTSLVSSTLKATMKRTGQRDVFVLDMCSGRGVKAGQILQECQDLNLRLECWELSEGRHRAAKRELARVAAATASTDVKGRVTLRQGDARKLVPGNSESDRPDFILLDAPCSGSGTWTRKPDSKWRLTWEQLDRLTATQKNLLERAVTLVAPGGTVLYVTCSLLKQENESIVAEILARHPECTELPVNLAGLTSANVLHKGKPWGTYLWPETPWLDGFYCALILKRQG